MLKYEYTSKKKGRGISSILMQKVGKGRNYKRQKTDDDNAQSQFENQTEEEAIRRSREIAE